MNLKPVTVEQFRGINNRLPDDRLDKPATRGAGVFVRDAVNVDLTEARSFQRRGGYERVIEASNCRGLREVATGFYYATGTDLMFFNGTSTKVGELADPLAQVAYADTPVGLAWSDGFSLNMIEPSGSRLMSPQAPNPMPTVAAGAGGALHAGSYGVSFATELAGGRRSQLSYPQFVDVPEGGFISIAAAGHTQPIAVFVTAQDGSILYREASIAVGATAAVLPIVRSAGEPIRYQVMSPLPAGSVLGYHRGRLLSADYGYLSYSLPFNLGLYRPESDFIPFGAPITLVAPVEAGVFVATAEHTYFLPGADIAQATVGAPMPFGAVPGTLTREPNRKGAMWFSSRGAVRAGDDGSIELLQDKDMAFSPAQAGAAFVREENGLRSFVTALATNGPPAGAVFGGYIDAEVIN